MLNHRRLKAHRRRLRLSLGQAALQSDIPRSCIFDYERGHSMPSLQRFRRLCKTYRCDAFEILELLFLCPINRNDLHRFRVACRREGQSPGEALQIFIKIYSESE